VKSKNPFTSRIPGFFANAQNDKKNIPLIKGIKGVLTIKPPQPSFIRRVNLFEILSRITIIKVHMGVNFGFDGRIPCV
jgi:hypothetical protein